MGLAEEARRHSTSPQQVAWLDRLEAELDNFRAVLGWEGARGAGGETAARLTAALGQFWYLRGHFAEGQGWVRAALTLPAAAGPTALRAELLGEGVGYWFQGDDDLARTALEESVAIFRRLGDARRLATMLHRLGQVVHRRGDAAAAAGHQEEALALARAAGDDYTVAFALVGLGNVALEQGSRDAARDHYEEALALRRALGHTWGVAHALNSLADVALAEGDYARAAELARECLVLRRAIGDRGNLALTLGELAGATAALGQPARAARLFGAAEALRESMGVRLASPADRAEADQLAALARCALGATGIRGGVGGGPADDAGGGGDLRPRARGGARAPAGACWRRRPRVSEPTRERHRAPALLGEGPELAEQAEGVDLVPVLDDPPAGEADDLDAGELHLPAGRRHAGEGAPVGGPHPPAVHHLVAPGDVVLLDRPHVFEGRAEPGGHGLGPGRAGGRLRVGGVVEDVVRRQHLVEHRRVAPDPRREEARAIATFPACASPPIRPLLSAAVLRAPRRAPGC